jgi:hypothetical protein
VRRLQGGPGAACQRNGQDAINVVGHIIRQKGGQAACPLHNKCGGRVAQSPYVMLRPLAYVTDDKSCGSIRPSAERGAEALRIEPGHALIPDPCLGYDTPSPGTLLWVVRSSLGGVRTLSNAPGRFTSGVRVVRTGVLCLLGPMSLSPRTPP